MHLKCCHMWADVSKMCDNHVLKYTFVCMMSHVSYVGQTFSTNGYGTCKIETSTPWTCEHVGITCRRHVNSM